MIHRKLQGLMSPIEKVARVAGSASDAARSLDTRPSGSVSYDNADGTRTVIGPATGDRTVATHVGDTTAPPVPSGVSAWSGDGSLHVSWDGTLDGEVPADFDHVTILVDGEEVAKLSSAGSVTVGGVEAGATVSVAATAEDDCCLADGTTAHNVSEPCAAISVEIRDVVAEVRADADAHGEQIEAVRSDVASFKATAAATYSTKFEVDEKTGAIAKTLAADYAKSSDVSKTYAEKTELSQAVNQLSSTMTSNYSAFTDYRASNDTALSKAQTAANDAQSTIDTYKAANDRAVADAKSAGTTAQNQLSSYKSTNDAAVADAKKAGTDAQSDLDTYKTSTDKKLGELSNIANNAIESWYLKGAPTTSNAPAKDWATDALKKQHAGDLYMDVDTGYSYRWSGTAWVQVKDSDVTKALKEVHTIKTDYATKSELKSTDEELSGKISDSLTTATSYTDGQISQEVTNRNAAIQAQADSISLDVSKTYTKAETFSAYQSDADQRIATANSNASTAKSTAATAASDAATAKTNASTAGKAAADVQSDLDDYKSTVADTYATKSSLELANDSIESEVKARAETDKVVASHTSKITQLSDSITSAVSGGTTYTAPDGTQKTNALATKVNQTATDVTTAIQDASTAKTTASTAATDASKAKTDASSAVTTANTAKSTADGLTTLIRQYSDGVLVCKTGKSVGALVNAAGSFDVVPVTWSGSTPKAGTAIASFDGDSIDLGGQTSAVNMCGGTGMVTLDKTSNQIAIGGKNGAYLQDIEGIKSGSDQGVGYSYSNGKGKAMIVATEVAIHGSVSYSGSSITVNGRKSDSAAVARNIVDVGRTLLYDYGGDNGVWYEVHGGYVWVRCHYVNGLNSSGWKVPKLLPDAYRPKYGCWYPGAIKYSNNVGAMWVGSDGEVWLYDYGNTGGDVCATGVYPLKK
jgi:hypothetical protein